MEHEGHDYGPKLTVLGAHKLKTALVSLDYVSLLEILCPRRTHHIHVSRRRSLLLSTLPLKHLFTRPWNHQ